MNTIVYSQSQPVLKLPHQKASTQVPSGVQTPHGQCLSVASSSSVISVPTRYLLRRAAKRADSSQYSEIFKRSSAACTQGTQTEGGDFEAESFKAEGVVRECLLEAAKNVRSG
jgi:hypothetical protein